MEPSRTGTATTLRPRLISSVAPPQAACCWRTANLMKLLTWLPMAMLAGLILAPTSAEAQASIAGVVRDTSGAVLPGVTVEASSPALIEKTRTVVTDGTGQYKIEQLRPGAYAITFTLSGFSIVKRDGIELTGSFAATVNVELKSRLGRGNDRRLGSVADRGRAERRPATGAGARSPRRDSDLAGRSSPTRCSSPG